MRFESEVVAGELLPAIRKIIADRLHQDYGHTQEEIAQELEVTQPAVSQYLRGERASKEVVEALVEDPQIDVLLDDAVSKAAKNQDFSGEVRDVVSTVRDKGILKEKFEDTARCL